MNDNKMFEQEIENTPSYELLPLFNEEKTKIMMSSLLGEPISFERLRRICEKMNPVVKSMDYSGFDLDSDDKALWDSALRFTDNLLH